MKPAAAAAARQSVFIWETHGIHVGTAGDHVKHGIDEVSALVENAVRAGRPSVTFIIHTPRPTRFRYQREIDTNVKFIRGHASYFEYVSKMEQLKIAFADRIRLRCGIELDWLGSGFGHQWNTAKLFQASGVDFVVGAVHFSREGVPYDGSREESQRLIQQRGGLEEFWSGYLDEVVEMVATSWETIHVVAHLDLPKVYAPIPQSLTDFGSSGAYLARRLVTLLEMIRDLNLALDLNLSGLRMKCGIYPEANVLRRACEIGIPIAIGSDAHSLQDAGQDYECGVKYARDAGYGYYVSFSRGIPEKRSFAIGQERYFKILNLGIEMLNLRFDGPRRLEIPEYSFGGDFGELSNVFAGTSSLGAYSALRVRKGEKSVTLSDRAPQRTGQTVECLFSHHTDTPGTLSVLFNTLASEEINVETAHLNSLRDGTATAYLTLTGSSRRIQEAVDFAMGTASERFMHIEPQARTKLPSHKRAPVYLLEVDGIELPLPVTQHMIFTVHNNSPGVLLILLSALASRNVNVVDLQLGQRGARGIAVLGVDGDPQAVADLLGKLGPQYYEASQILLAGFGYF